MKRLASLAVGVANSIRRAAPLLLATLAPAVQAQDTRGVTQPTTPAPPYCQVLRASLPRLSAIAFVPPRAFDDTIENAPPDTARINQAILQCSQSVAPGFNPPAVVECRPAATTPRSCPGRSSCKAASPC